MVIETITCKDFDKNERTETLYFNLTKAECMEMEMVTEGGLKEYLEKIVKDGDNQKIVDFFKMFILKAYGEKSADGHYFRKSKQRSEDFASTEAYSELFMKLINDGEYMKTFVANMLPGDYSSEDIDKIVDEKIEEFKN